MQTQEKDAAALRESNSRKDLQQDQFCDPSYVDQQSAIASVVVLNEKVNGGYFIPVTSMAKCGWINFDEKELIEHTFASGNTEQGILITAPRVLVCTKTELYMIDKKQTLEQKSKVVLGYYNPDHRNNPDVRSERIYLLFFLDKDNQFLHTSPLKYTAHGVNGTTFALERSRFKSELESCHALANGIAARPKNESFHSLGVFAFELKAELVGDKQKSWCCRVVGHEQPTIQNWKDYFIGYSEARDMVWQAFVPEEKIDVLKALPEVPSGKHLHERLREESFPPQLSREVPCESWGRNPSTPNLSSAKLAPQLSQQEDDIPY